VAGTLAELAVIDGARAVAVARELTKLHEEVWRGTLAESAVVFEERSLRGEVVLVVGGAPPAGPVGDEEIDEAVRIRLRSRRGSGDGPRQISDAVAQELGVARRTVYQATLRIRDEVAQQPD
jgi:16S rRNA (cytidine1402-2'-O)-methyltransferase